MRSTTIWVAAWLLAWPAGAAPADAPNAERVRALVKQLDDETFVARQEAERELRKVGVEGFLLLLKELTAGHPLEVTRRLERIVDDVAQDALAPLIRGLGDEEFEAREQADRKLRQYGKGILPGLERAISGKPIADPEIRYRLGRIVRDLKAQK